MFKAFKPSTTLLRSRRYGSRRFKVQGSRVQGKIAALSADTFLRARFELETFYASVGSNWTERMCSFACDGCGFDRTRSRSRRVSIRGPLGGKIQPRACSPAASRPAAFHIPGSHCRRGRQRTADHYYPAASASARCQRRYRACGKQDLRCPTLGRWRLRRAGHGAGTLGRVQAAGQALTVVLGKKREARGNRKILRGSRVQSSRT